MQRWTAATIDRSKPIMTLDGGSVTMTSGGGGGGGSGVLEVPCSGIGVGVGVMGTMTLASRMGNAAVGMNGVGGSGSGGGSGGSGGSGEEEDSWFYGFLGLARALHAKDVDNDG